LSKFKDSPYQTDDVDQFRFFSTDLMRMQAIKWS